MAVHLVYRSYGGENGKGRPPWFSKAVAAASFARAAENAGLEPTWVNDGPIPEGTLAVMRRSGTILQLAGGPVGMRRSYVTALRMAVEGDWADEDVVYFCEDDYLHTPDAFVKLAAAAEQCPQISYFALYGSTPDFPDSGEWPNGYEYPRDWHRAPDLTVGDQRWVHVASTASTFGARVGALRSDYSLFRQAMLPFRRRYLDHETCLLYQGHRPYRGSEYVMGLRGDFVPGVRGVARAAFLVPFRVALNARAHRNAASPHLLYAAAPNLGCHAEDGMMTPGRDWDAVAAEVRAWAEGEGLTLSASPSTVGA